MLSGSSRIRSGAVRLTLLVAMLAVACRSASTEPVAVENGSEASVLEGRWDGHGPGGACTITIEGSQLRFQSRPDFWFETTFAIHSSTDSQQLHATIVRESEPDQDNVGTIVVAIFELKDGVLTLGVIEDFNSPPPGPVAGDLAQAMDVYVLERV